MDTVLSVINVNKKFDGTIAFDDFSLEISIDSIIGIRGWRLFFKKFLKPNPA